MGKIRRRVSRAILVAVLTAIALLIARSRGFDPALPFAFNCRYLSDGFFVVGFMVASVGALTLIASTGVLDIMSYAARSLLMLFSFLKKPKDFPDYYDYKLAREARRGRRRYGTLLTGLIYLALAGGCLLIYYRG